MHGPYHDVPTVAENLGLHPSTVRKKIYSGEIVAVKLGNSPNGQLRIPQSSIEEYLAAHVFTPTRES